MNRFDERCHPTSNSTQDPTTALMESLQAIMQTMVTTQQDNVSSSIREAKYQLDFKRGDPCNFSGTADDPIVAQLWLTSMDTMVRLTNCSEDHNVQCATFMLRGDVELWWQFSREILSPEGGVISWSDFKSAFLEEYYSTP